ncbi:17829_t:CDS:1, partial [Cetraspora pellucida]
NKSAQDPQKITFNDRSDNGALKHSSIIKCDFNVNNISISVPDNNTTKQAIFPYIEIHILNPSFCSKKIIPNAKLKLNAVG